jgi:hypothetical protein
MPYYITTGTGASAKTYTYNMTYQVTYGIGDSNGFLSDYRTSDTASSLNTSSNLTMAVGGKSGCTAVSDPGGEGTYYAGAIYAAQTALQAEAYANPGSQNVIILVSDGDASATSAQMATSTTSSTGATNGGTYPSYKNECGQAITAAHVAALAGTKVYAVAYGAETTGCTTDSSGSYPVNTGGTKTFTPTPCSTMQNIASLPQYFYSDYNQSGSGVDTGCTGYSSTTALNDIFTAIAGDLTVARLIPDGTT